MAQPTKNYKKVTNPKILKMLGKIKKVEGDIAEKLSLPAAGGEMGWGDVAKSALLNFPQSFDAAISAMGQPIARPIETIKGLSNLELEDVGEALKNRYGSVDALKETMSQDPAGFALDLSTVLGGVGSVAKLGGASKLAKVAGAAGDVLDPISQIPRAIPRAVPEKMYQSAAKMSTTLDPAKRLAAARTALREGIYTSPSGVAKLWAKVREYSDEVKNIIDSQISPDRVIRSEDIVGGIDDVRNRIISGVDGDGVGIGVVDPEPLVKALDKFKERVTSGQFAQLNEGRKLTAKQAQQLKQNIYKELEKEYQNAAKRGISTGKQAIVDAKKAIANSLKNAIEEIHPELKTLNAKEGELLNLHRAIEQAVRRIENRDLFGLGLTSKTGVGELVGQSVGVPGVGGATGFGLGLIDRPIIKQRLAVALDKARRGATSNVGRALFQTGRNGDNREQYGRQ